MNTRHTRRSKTLGTVGAVVLSSLALALAGCGGESNASSSGSPSGRQPQQAENIYQFDQLRVADKHKATPYVVSEPKSVTIRLSDELKSAAPQGNPILVDSYTLTQHAFRTGICRLDVRVNYADGGRSAITGPLNSTSISEQERFAAEENRVAQRLTAGAFLGASHPTLVSHLPTDDQIAKMGFYLTSDYSAMTFVDKCGTSATDAITDLTFPFRDQRTKESGWKQTAFAGADITVMTGGTVVVSGGVDADLSATGKWTPKAS